MAMKTHPVALSAGPRWIGLLGMLLASATLVVPAAAQPSSPPVPAGAETEPEAEGADAVRERVRERIRLMRAWRLTEAIELDELTAIRLFDHLEAYDVRIHQVQDELAGLGRELRAALSGEGEEEGVVRGLVQAITEAHLRIEQLRAELVLTAGDFLSAEQQAALMLFLPDFDRQIQRLVREARRGRGERMRGPPPRGGEEGERRLRRER